MCANSLLNPLDPPPDFRLRSSSVGTSRPLGPLPHEREGSFVNTFLTSYVLPPSSPPSFAPPSQPVFSSIDHFAIRYSHPITIFTPISTELMRTAFSDHGGVALSA